ncbi:hypothetical protein KSS87_006561 [Heliosperma pusillum]|nr:hypothetical protein KSS87_006561 [Heliosperma pusillum]
MKEGSLHIYSPLYYSTFCIHPHLFHTSTNITYAHLSLVSTLEFNMYNFNLFFPNSSLIIKNLTNYVSFY